MHYSVTGITTHVADTATACYRVWNKQPILHKFLQLTSFGTLGVICPNLLNVNTLYSAAIVGYSIFQQLDAKEIKRAQKEITKCRYLEYQEAHGTCNAQDPRPLLLVIEASFDDSGVLRKDRRGFFSPLEKEYEIVFRYVQSTTALAQEITDIGCQKKICALWINAHGDPTSISLGELQSGTHCIDQKTLLADLEQPLRASLTEDAAIILDSCSTGSVVQGGVNIAEAFHRQTQRTVFAATEGVTNEEIQIQQARPLMVQFRTTHTSDQTGKDITYIAGIRP